MGVCECVKRGIRSRGRMGEWMDDTRREGDVGAAEGGTQRSFIIFFILSGHKAVGGTGRGGEAWALRDHDGAADDLSRLNSLRHLLIIEAIICSQPALIRAQFSSHFLPLSTLIRLDENGSTKKSKIKISVVVLCVCASVM